MMGVAKLPFFFFLGECGGLNSRALGPLHNRGPTRLEVAVGAKLAFCDHKL